MSASSRDDRGPNGPKVIAMHGGAQKAPGAAAPSELDALFHASRQVEAMLVRERSQAAKLRKDLVELQSLQASETAQSREQLQRQTARAEELKAALQAAHAKLQAAAAHIQKLQQALALERSRAGEAQKQAQLDLGVLKQSLEHLRHSNQGLERELARVRPELARAQLELERAQAGALEREHRYHAIALNHKAQEKSHQDLIASLKSSLNHVQSELARHKAQAIEIERFREETERNARRHAELQHRLQEALEARRVIEARLKAETRQREHCESVARSTLREKEALRAAVRNLEQKLIDAESRLASAPGAGATASSFAPGIDDLDSMAIVGYPVIRETEA